MKELLKESIVEVKITSKGKSKEEAYTNVFNQLKSEIYSYIDGYLVEMHVESFQLVNEYTRTIIKKILGLFLPVEHYLIEVEVILKVRVTEIIKQEEIKNG